MSYGIIYKATGLDGKVYIGQTTGKLAEKQKFHKTQMIKRARENKRLFPFQLAILEYGIDGFQWEIIDRANDKKELERKEKHWIVHYNSAVPQFGYNGTWGGSDGIPNKEACKKMSEAKKGKRMSETHRLNMCMAVAKLDPETVHAIRDYLSNGASLRETAKKFGIGKGTVCGIKSGRRYAWA
jgi:transposase